MRLLIVCWFAVIVACGGGASSTVVQPLPHSDAAQTYPIRFSRPSRVGERTHIVSDESTTKATKITKNGAVNESPRDHTVLHIDAVATTLAVDDKGRATHDRYEVAELLSNGKPLITGVVEVTRARREDDATVLANGGPATKEVKEALKSLLKLSVGGPSDDDVFGTTQPQAVGAHWPINTGLAHDDLLEDTEIDAKSVTGDAWLAGITHVGDAECLDVWAKLGLDGLTLPDIPQGATVEVGHADVEMNASLPVDGRTDRLADNMKLVMTIRLRVATPNGDAATVTVTVTSKRASSTTPV